MGDATGHTDYKITLYTNHICPWAHRAHIVLAELGLKYEEVIIDLASPRPDWYLKINPRGLVPAIVYSDSTLNEPITILESGLVVQFLLDAFPTLSKGISSSSTSVESAHFKYRVGFFVDTWLSKVNTYYMKSLIAEDPAAKEAQVDEIVSAVKEHIEPLLYDVGPFFGGSDTITLAEILTASFVIRFVDLADGKVRPKSLVEKLYALPNFAKWSKHVLAQKSVTSIWDTEEMRKMHYEALPKIRAKHAAASK